jgi:hypothetical protein
MVMHIQNRHDFSEDVRSRLDDLAGAAWEYSSIDERTGADGSVEILYVIHDAGGNELRSVVARRASGEVTYTVEG